jgi:hypothetical protein
MHVEAISLGCVCGIRILSKTKYLHFGSVRRVARDVGTDVTCPLLLQQPR